MTGELLDRALIEEASKKSGLIWVEAPGVPARPLWHVWHEGAACVVGDGPVGESMPERWARECRVLRLEPTGATGTLPDGDLSAAPLPTPATTRTPMPAGLPRLLAKRKRRG